ncbi:MAG: hypothetical protein HY537_01530, partial [Deltaproteobacteria bacterium]|nr:hypothetical protein [Deltaproteobacteria bacterium]
STSEPITEIRGINRLFIKKAITSNGEPLTIDVNQIITKVAMITTYLSTPKAPVGVEGKSPGDIRIRAKSAQGVLYIFSKGGNGGDGEKGKDGARGGNSARVLVEIEDPTNVRIRPWALPGHGGLAGGPYASTGPKGNEEAVCLRLGTAVFGDCIAFPGKR